MILRYQGVLGVLGLFLGNLAKLIILGDTVGIMGFLATTLLNIIQ